MIFFHGEGSARDKRGRIKQRAQRAAITKIAKIPVQKKGEPAGLSRNVAEAGIARGDAMPPKKGFAWVLLVLSIVFWVGSQLALPGRAEVVKKSLPDFRSIRFSPDVVRIPAVENEMSRRYLKIVRKMDPDRDEDLQRLAGPAQLRPLLRRRLLVWTRDRQSGGHDGDRQHLAGIR